jgi:hypothetical protein
VTCPIDKNWGTCSTGGMLLFQLSDDYQGV